MKLRGAQAIALAPDGSALVTQHTLGKGKVILTTIPYLLGVDERATPIAAKLMIHLCSRLTPVRVVGDVEWQVNRTEKGWVVLLFNNKGVYKPQQGLAEPRREEVVEVTLTTALPIKEALEWVQERTLSVDRQREESIVRLVLPAGGIRVVELVP